MGERGEQMPSVRLSDRSPFWVAGYNAMMATDTSCSGHGGILPGLEGDRACCFLSLANCMPKEKNRGEGHVARPAGVRLVGEAWIHSERQ